jgi:hypothetical protein
MPSARDAGTTGHSVCSGPKPSRVDAGLKMFLAVTMAALGIHVVGHFIEGIVITHGQIYGLEGASN